MLDRIRIVLVHTSHPGNIGSAARAMKTMGINRLYLVGPEVFPHEKARELASGALDVLEQAVVVETLTEAIADCTWVVGTSARSRRIPWPLQNPREVAQSIQSIEGEIAILFGRERTGLTNDELERCHVHLHIPSHPVYSSLNLAAAVQIVAYELYLAAGKSSSPKPAEWDYPLATAQEMTFFFDHLQKVLTDLQFLKASAPRRLMTRLRRLFLRTQLDQMEVNMLRGILTAIEGAARKD